MRCASTAQRCLNAFDMITVCNDQHNTTRAHRISGFTLIELLTVIAVIAILAAILVPLIGAIKVRADQTTCASNMRQIGIALRTYANEHQGRLPGISHDRPVEESWIFTLSKYISDAHAIRVSPSDPKAKERLSVDYSTTYVMNDLFFMQARDHRGRLVGPDRTNLLILDDPSRTMLAFVGAEHRGLAPSNDHTHASSWGGNWSAFVNDVSPDLHRRGSRSTDRSHGSSNYLFADGRVESIEAAKMLQKIRSGVNIALPPNER